MFKALARLVRHRQYGFAAVDLVITVGVFLYLGVVRADVVVIAAYLLVPGYLVVTERIRYFRSFALASMLAVAWIVVGHSQYMYNQEFLSVFGVPMFPLFGWAVGLFAVRLLFTHWRHRFSRVWTRFAAFTVFYSVLLIMGEAVGYHVFNIRNVATASASPLPVCNCLHAPWWMKTWYFGLGPALFVLDHYFTFPDADPET